MCNVTSAATGACKGTQSSVQNEVRAIFDTYGSVNALPLYKGASVTLELRLRPTRLQAAITSGAHMVEFHAYDGPIDRACADDYGRYPTYRIRVPSVDGRSIDHSLNRVLLRVKEAAAEHRLPQPMNSEEYAHFIPPSLELVTELGTSFALSRPSTI